MNKILFNEKFQSSRCHDTLSVAKTPKRLNSPLWYCNQMHVFVFLLKFPDNYWIYTSYSDNHTPSRNILINFFQRRKINTYVKNTYKWQWILHKWATIVCIHIYQGYLTELLVSWQYFSYVEFWLTQNFAMVPWDNQIQLYSDTVQIEKRFLKNNTVYNFFFLQLKITQHQSIILYVWNFCPLSVHVYVGAKSMKLPEFSIFFSHFNFLFFAICENYVKFCTLE